MDSVRLTYDQHAFIFWLILAAAVVILAIWVGTVQRNARNVQRRLDSLLGAGRADDVGSMLVEYLTTVRHTAASVARIQDEHDQVIQLMPSVIRHVGLVRFSPFHDTGGDQSFALALLDGRRDGVVITALHSRTDSRLYAKPVERGASSYSLTPEEREAMDRALSAQQAVTRS
ncbi:MAG TPA: DUF4446 family protein [Chloroflexota bacterium]